MSSLLGFLFCISLFSAVALSTTASQVALFVFGDSLYDPGNNDFLNISSDFKANFPPYGENFFKIPTGRFSDGRLISDFIAMYANLSLWIPYLDPGNHNHFIHGANFASAGSCILVDSEPLTLNLEIQLSFFKNVTSLLRQQLGDTETKKLLMNAVYLSSHGGVDYMCYKDDYPNVKEAEYVKWVIGNLTEVVKEIYDIGGRKFMFQNIAPIGCTPEARQLYNLSINECVEYLLELPILHNSALQNACKELESQLPGFRYSIFDFYHSLMDRIQDPSKYGFKVGNIACCGNGKYRGQDCGHETYELCSNPNEYLFFDGTHPSEHGCSQLAELMWTGDPNVVGPVNMKNLIELDPENEIFFLGLDSPSIESHHHNT